MAVMAIAFVVYCNVRIGSYAKSRVFDSLDELPHCHTALVLGTSPKGRFGGPNRFFIARINAAAELFEAGKVERILVSGDNRHANYNEPEAMKQALVEKGIPADVIFLDYAGFRTFDSVVRAREVFGQDSFVVVSQKFHNERAVFIAGKKGTEAIGYNAQDVSLRSGGVLTHVREWGARCKVFLDILTGKKPHFLRTDAGDISWHCHQQL
ncbi:MAG: YdcF family protein [Bacteroidales bacterium]|nr:YdcF family protein [Bacteroidales bacterium]